MPLPLRWLEFGPVSLFPLVELFEDVIFVCFLMISNPCLCDSWVQLGWFSHRLKYINTFAAPLVYWSWGICEKKRRLNPHLRGCSHVARTGQEYSVSASHRKYAVTHSGAVAQRCFSPQLTLRQTCLDGPSCT